MQGRGTTGALLDVKRMQEECKNTKAFVLYIYRYNMKAFDGASKKVIEYVMRRKGLPKVIVKIVMDKFRSK